MTRSTLRLLLAISLIPLLAFAASHKAKRERVEKELPLPAPIEARVVQVLDGDTLVLASGERVRLVDINTPEGPHDGAPAEPFAEEAKQRLKDLALDKTVRLETSRKERDVYGRRLAHVYAGSTWVNGTLVREGLAVAYTFADNQMKAPDILKAENEARTAQRGLWSHPRWNIKPAAACCTETEMGRFQLVEGTVVDSGGDKDHIYLNFGPDYRTDFTIRIARKDAKKYFLKSGIKDIPATYVGRTVRVHGQVVPVYGAMVVVSHPAQVEILK
ncbi:MAG: thermonuclease family protein [Alphaproteobacteria bacterium]